MSEHGRQFETISLEEVLRKTVDATGPGETLKASGQETYRNHSHKVRTHNMHEHTLRHAHSHQSSGKIPQDAPLQSGDESTQKRSRRRILVVDDERVIADTLATILRNAGYDAAACYDAPGAFACCDSFVPDLIISDVVMPGISGVEMAITMRQRFPECKILLFSGQASTVSLLDEARRGGYDFELLSKPIHPSELLAKLAKDAPVPMKAPASALLPEADGRRPAQDPRT
jgi:CheY-like chemotaxis protein